MSDVFHCNRSEFNGLEHCYGPEARMGDKWIDAKNPPSGMFEVWIRTAGGATVPGHYNYSKEKWYDHLTYEEAEVVGWKPEIHPLVRPSIKLPDHSDAEGYLEFMMGKRQQPPWASLASKFERKLFEFMRFHLISKVFITEEGHSEGGTYTRSLVLHVERPGGEAYTEYDFEKLLRMSEDEFQHLPGSPNRDAVEEWRRELRRVISAKKPFPTAPFNSTDALVPDEDNV